MILITPDNFLDFGYIIIDLLIGGVWFFLAIGLTFIAYKSMENRVAFQPTVVLMIVFATITLTYVYNVLIWGLILILVGAVGYGIYSKAITK